eukprot:scaffold122559_cov58-Attheya_sp.AAC.8
MQAGTSKPILEDHQAILYIENQWMVTLRNYMIQIKATIKEEKPWTIPSACVHDQHIMDAFLQSPSIPEKDYAALNYCRLYLRVKTLSDIHYNIRRQANHARHPNGVHQRLKPTCRSNRVASPRETGQTNLEQMGKTPTSSTLYQRSTP